MMVICFINIIHCESINLIKITMITYLVLYFFYFICLIFYSNHCVVINQIWFTYVKKWITC